MGKALQLPKQLAKKQRFFKNTFIDIIIDKHKTNPHYIRKMFTLYLGKHVGDATAFSVSTEKAGQTPVGGLTVLCVSIQLKSDMFWPDLRNTWPDKQRGQMLQCQQAFGLRFTGSGGNFHLKSAASSQTVQISSWPTSALWPRPLREPTLMRSSDWPTRRCVNHSDATVYVPTCLSYQCLGGYKQVVRLLSPLLTSCFLSIREVASVSQLAAAHEY